MKVFVVSHEDWDFCTHHKSSLPVDKFRERFIKALEEKRARIGIPGSAPNWSLLKIEELTLDEFFSKLPDDFYIVKSE